MNIDGPDPSQISKLLSDLVELASCAECCRYYIAPETPPCGHSLCHSCWKGRRTCPRCDATVTRRTLKLNVPLRTHTEHVHALADAFETLFNVKLDEIDLDILGPKMQSNDPTKNVKEWLASSQNQFSVPLLSSQASSLYLPGPIELNASKIQIHTQSKKLVSPTKVIKTPQPQDDWDKIETITDTNNIQAKNKENIVGPMDIEPFAFDENEYNNDHPRRSHQKKDTVVPIKQTIRTRSIDKVSSKNSESETDQKSKTRQNWSNVKKMKKEFNKLNRINKSKLNVSIEMCKKAQGAKAKSKVALPLQATERPPYDIDFDLPDTAQNTVDNKTTPDKNDIDNVNLTDRHLQEISSNSGTIKKTTIDKTISKPVLLENKSRVDDYSSGNKQMSTEDLQSSRKNEETSRSVHLPFSQKEEKKANKDTDVQIVQTEINSENIGNNDVEISIKIGNIITNIYIKQKQKDVSFKVNADSAIQTSLGPHHLMREMCDKGTNAISNLAKETSEKGVNVHLIELELGDENKVTVNKSSTTKLDTASADTVTAKDLITDTVEKELCDIMESVEDDNQTKKSHNVNVTQKLPSTKPSPAKPVSKVTDDEKEDIDELNDLDLFASGSVKEADVHLLKNSKLQSEILKPTLKSVKSQKVPDKRERDANDDVNVEMPSNKKQKVTSQVENKDIATEKQKEISEGPDSEALTYDNLISQVFANIDADIESDKKSTNDRKSQKLAEKEHPKNLSQIIYRTQTTQKKTMLKQISTSNEVVDISELKEQQKDSENVFSMIENEPQEMVEKPQEVTDNLNHVTEKSQPQLATDIENILTPGMRRDLDTFRGSTQAEKMDVEMVPLEPVMATPHMEEDDSDKSVVEETPQKNISFQKPRPRSDASNSGCNIDKLQSNKEFDPSKNSNSQIMQTIINITDSSTPGDSKAKVATDVNNVGTAQTPLTITKFFNQIQHNSTPVSRKTLNFENDSLDDERTLCPTTTSLEKDFLAKAFEGSQVSPLKRSLSVRSMCHKDTRNYCLAGSCLTPPDIIKIKLLCKKQGWTYVDKYTEQLTHLVVAVDKEGKSHRTVKYICALAASKLIVSFAWIESCLSGKGVVDEAAYAVLDASGEPGPTRSRRARQKVFAGITFYCMPPFSILDLDTLQYVLRSAGGLVAESMQEVRLTGEGSEAGVKLVLAEPENTQEDRFIYLTMEQSIVPVNYEWVLNCLGIYDLCTIRDLLLCPATLLPKAVATWPAALLKEEDDHA